ncbi:MAG: tetratricopeptide repeat protein, partial [Candidatus Desantisbacteria bacterium]
SVIYSKESIPRPDLTIEMEDIFPSKYKRYASKSAGRLKITNTTNQTLSRIKIKIFVPEYMNLPTEYEVHEINPGDSKEIPLKPVFNNNIFSVDEDTPVQIEVVVEYLWRDKPQQASSVKTTTLLNKNAIDWHEENSIAAFVTPRDAVVNRFSREITNMMGRIESPIENMLFGIAIFSALNNMPVVYVPDPNAPFSKISKQGILLDTVQYPADTLCLKGGDCDDLTVLYAACLENVGIQTAVALSPGHIFLLFNSGVSQKNADMITLDKERYVVRDGYVWLPLEITEIGSSFFDAWEKGSQEYNTWSKAKELKVIDMNDAWNEYAPASLIDRPQQFQMSLNEGVRETVQNNIDTLCKYQCRVKDNRIDEYVTWLKAHPEDTVVANNLGVLYARHDLLEKAIAQFQNILVQSPQHAEAHNNLGNVYAQNGSYTLAIEEYKSALQTSIDDGGIYFNMGLSCLLMDSEEALDCFKKSWMLCEKNDTLDCVWDIDPDGKGLRGDPKNISKETIKKLLDNLYKCLETVEEPSPQQKVIKQKRMVLKTLFAGTRGDAPFENQAVTWTLYWK